MSPHGLPSYSMHKRVSGASFDMLVKGFEAELARQEDILFGIALFYEGIVLLLARQTAVVETHRKQFRNIIQNGRRVLDWGKTLLIDVRKEKGKAALLRSFTFMPGHGHPEPERLVARAEMLVATYNTMFPGRGKEQALSEAETLALFEAASEKMAEPMPLDVNDPPLR
ncbi:MAG: hypothetical protein O3C57_08625 [Verrucomicrobia bacterium]|nr:hypothetical protein [Verrucomicrobiota bacterium]